MSPEPRYLLQPRSWPLRFQVRALVSLLIVVMALVVGEMRARHQADEKYAAIGTSLLQTARQMADRLSTQMAERMHDVTLLSQLDVLRDATSPGAARAALEKLRIKLPAYAWIGLTDTEGNVVAATDDLLLGKSIAARPVFQNGRRGLWSGDVHEAALLADFVPHEPGAVVRFVDVAAPVQNSDGSLRGVLALHLSWQWADQLRQALRPRGSGDDIELMVFSERGDLLLRPARRTDTPLGLPGNELRRLEEHAEVQTWSDGIEAPTAVAATPSVGAFHGFGWRVVARDVSPAARATLLDARLAVLPLIAGIAALCALAAWWLIGIVVSPVDRLVQTLNGPSTRPGTLPSGARVKRRSDVQRIAAAVVELQNHLKESDAKVQVLQQKAHVDSLTGLWNRNYLAAMSEKLVEAMSQKPVEFCVLCLDLDSFKPVNDKYGHEAGDQVLVQVAKRLRQVARADDLVFRLGGDEFMLLLTCPLGEGAALSRTIAQRVVTDLQRPMSYRTLSNLRIGCSVGAGVWPQDGATLTDVMGHADEALYAAKRAGRGQFRQYVAQVA
jgi:diguanylate cyclase (GGDEF)-like protein